MPEVALLFQRRGGMFDYEVGLLLASKYDGGGEERFPGWKMQRPCYSASSGQRMED